MTSADQAAAFEAIRVDARALLGGLSDEQLNWRSSPGRWSIAQCLEHLLTVHHLIEPKLRVAVHTAPPSDKPYRPGFLARLIIGSSEPPASVPMKSPKIYVPPVAATLTDLRPAVDAMQRELVGLAEATEGVNRSRPKIASPVTKIVRLGLGEWFDFLAAHERRHLWQARQVRQHPDFPGA